MSQLDEGQADVAATDLPVQDEGAAAAPVVPAEKEPVDELDVLYPEDSPKEPVEEGEEPGEDDDLGDDDLDEVDDLPAIEAPRSWKDAEKEAFAKLPREHQEIINRRETERDRFVQQKAQEAAQAKTAAERDAVAQIEQIRRQEAEQYEQLASTLLPEPPNEQWLWMGNTPEERQEYQLAYQQQRAIYEGAVAQQQQLQQTAQSKRDEAQTLAQAQQQWKALSDRKELHEKRPDWFDEGSFIQLNDGTAVPTKLKPEVISRLTPIGQALGYPEELLAQAETTDLIALETAADWKAKADKYDELQKRRMAGVRAAKNLPRIAKPGAATGARVQFDDPLKLLYPND